MKWQLFVMKLIDALLPSSSFQRKCVFIVGEKERMKGICVVTCVSTRCSIDQDKEKSERDRSNLIFNINACFLTDSFLLHALTDICMIGSKRSLDILHHLSGWKRRYMRRRVHTANERSNDVVVVFCYSVDSYILNARQRNRTKGN